MIAEPLRLFDCNIETDGAVRDDRHLDRAGSRPAPAPAPSSTPARSRPARITSACRPCSRAAATRTARCGWARQLWANAGLRARRHRCVLLLRLLHLVRDHRARAVRLLRRAARAGPSSTAAACASTAGRLPTNTNGGQLSEAFIHGFNNNLEAVRQIRGTSTSQVADCELVLRRGREHRSDRGGDPPEVSVAWPICASR